MPPVLMRDGTANFIVSEANSMYRSREKADVIAHATLVLVAGTVLGRVVTGTATAAVKTVPGANTGNATSSAVTTTSDARTGIYQIRFLTATTFTVARPDGSLLANGATGVAYVGEIGFTLTVGATPMIAGDGFDVTVTNAPGDFARHDLAASNGTQNAGGILFEEVLPGTGAEFNKNRTIIVRDCEVNGAQLIHSAGATAAQIATANAALVALGIIVR